MEKLNILIAGLLIFLLGSNSLFAQATRKNTPERFDLLIVNGRIVTMDAQRSVIDSGFVLVRNGRIERVGDMSELPKNTVVRQTINAAGKAVIPGLVNAHTHIPMVLFRGISDDLDLNDWLTQYIFPAEARNVDENFVRAGTRLGLAEMIRGGTTTYCDMYYFEDAVADETAKAGVRGVLGETIIDFPVADNKTHDEAINYTEKFVRKWKNHRLIIPAFAPHAAYTVSTEHLQNVRRRADALGAPVVIHVSETNKEIGDITKQYGARPVEYLERIGFLKSSTVMAHTVHVNDREIDLMLKYDVGSAHCPQSNMKLASGVAPVPTMLRKNLRLGLGTDGAASNNDLDLWEEIDTAAKLHKLSSGDPKVVSAEEAFAMATIGGARALHLENMIGSLEAGKRADIVIVDLDNLNQTPVYNIYSALVYATKSSQVRDVIIEGRVVMRNKRLLTLSESAITKDANLYQKKIINSLSANK